MSNKTIKDVLNNYKYSLDNWMSRCDNNTPPANQKGLVIAKIDTEALSDIATILEEAKPEFEYKKLEPCEYCGEYQYSHDPDGHFVFATNKYRERLTERLGK